MTRDEQKHITAFVVDAASDAAEPIDVEADAIIRALFVRNPDAAYRITRLAMKLMNAATCTQAPCAPEEPARRGFFPTFFRRETASN